ncbi:MAG: DNA helicase II [Alphaproteobacteria bacterium]
MIVLTDEQRAAVDYPSDIALSACPGSGKTRVIIAKLIKLAESVEDTPLSIGCITYTNAAVDEIEARIKRVGTNRLIERCEISTIHSFCLNFILRPYGWLHPEVPKGFSILSNKMRDFEEVVRAVEDEIGRQIGRSTFDDYASLRRTTKGKPAGTGIESGVVTPETAARYWEIVRGRGYLDFAMILYYSFLILKNHPFVAKGIACRFAWLLVDEFQDTTDVQIAIFALLRRHLHTRFFLVGDEHQSINGFAGADSNLGHRFCDHIEADRTHALSGNFRCAPQIVTPAQTLIPREPKMHARGPAANCEGIVQYEHVENPKAGIEDYFLPALEALGIPYGKAAVLAPWWIHLVPVARHLRDLKVPVFGPGARPYKGSRLYARLAEELGSCIEQGALFDPSGVEKALFRLINEVMGQTRFDIFSYDGRRTSLALIMEAKRLATLHEGAVAWLEASSVSIGKILVREEWITPSAAKALVSSVENMKIDMKIAMKRSVDVDNMVISDLGLFANPDHAIKLITMHTAKGREFEAVAIINANDGHIPFFATMDDPEKVSESQRLFYVGLTRAKQYLLVLSDQTDSRRPPSRFVAQSGLS